MTSSARRGLLLVLLVLLGALPAVGGTATAAAAATTTRCGDAGTPAVLAQHNAHFYVDSATGVGLLSGYAGYTVRAGASARASLWLGYSDFSGGVLGLAPQQSPATALPDLPSGGSVTQYALMTATGTTTTPQSHVVTLYDGRPGAGRALCSRAFTYSDVVDTIKALANKVESVSASPSAATGAIGDAVTVTVTGNTGTLGAGPTNDPGVLNYTPNALRDFPADAWRLERTEMTVSPDGSAPPVTYVDRLYLAGASGPARPYTARYVFRAVGSSSAPAAVKPIQYIASGTQVKHTDLGAAGLYSLPAVSTEANVSLHKAVTGPESGILPVAGGRVEYAVTLHNHGASPNAVDWLADTLPAAATYVPGSLRLDGRAVEASVSGQELSVEGPLRVPASGSSVLTYAVDIGATPGRHTNSVVAHFGSVTYDSTRDVTSTAPATAEVTVPGAAGLSLVDDAATTPAQQAVDVPVLANDSSVSGLPLRVTQVSTPSSGSAVVGADGVVTFTPAAQASGAASFTYTATDGYVTSTATVSVVVTPKAVPDLYSTGSGVTLEATTSVLANDACTGCVVSVVGSPSFGTVTMAGSGTFTFVPGATDGVATFTYRATQPSGHAVDGTASVSVGQMTADRATTPYDTPVDVFVLRNDAGCKNCGLQSGGATPARGTKANVKVGQEDAVRYTPNTGTWGRDAFSYGITGSTGSDATPVSVLVGPPAGSLVTTYATPVTAPLPPGGSCTGCSYSAGAAPSRGSLAVDATTGAMTYEPAAGAAGTDTFGYVVQDPSGQTVTGTMTVTIGPDAVDDEATVLTGASVSGDVSGNDACPTTCSRTLETQPGSGSLTFAPDGTWTYIPADEVGTVSFTYRVASSQSGSVSDLATVRVLVKGARDDSATTAAGAPVDVAVMTNDVCVGCALASVSPPSSGSAEVQGGLVRYSPAPGFSGPASFTYALEQGSASTTAVVAVMVLPAGNADTATTVEGASVDVLPLANDLCVGCRLTAVASPGSGTATVADDVVTFAPAGPGSVSFAYDAEDAYGNPLSGQISVTVLEAPAVTGGTATTAGGSPVTVDVLGSDCAGCLLSVTEDPQDGSATVDVLGRLRYTPAPGFSGRDMVGFTATDPATGAWAAATLSVLVTPVVRDDLARTGVDVPIQVDVLVNDTCTACTLAVSSPPSGGSATVAAGGLLVEPPRGAVGTVMVGYTATDPATGETGSAVLTVEVNDAQPDAAALAHGGSVSGLAVLANDRCASDCVITSLSTPSAGTASSSGALVDWTPPAGFSGIATFDYTAGPPGGPTIGSSVRVLVAPPTQSVRVAPGGSLPGDVVPAASCADCTASLLSAPAAGEIDLLPSGAFTYTAQDGWTGTEPFRVRISDDVSGLSVEAAVEVRVAAVPAIEVVAQVSSPPARPVAGDSLTWTWTLTNTGDVPLTGVTLTPSWTGATTCSPTVDAGLARGATATCAASLVLTQAALDAGEVAGSAVAAGSGEGAPVSATTAQAVALTRAPALTLTGTAVLAGGTPTAPAVGDPVDVTYTATNAGNTSLSDVAVALASGPGLTCTGAAQAPGGALSCTGRHLVTQADLDRGRWDSAAAATAGAPGTTSALTASADTSTALPAKPASASPSPSSSPSVSASPSASPSVSVSPSASPSASATASPSASADPSPKPTTSPTTTPAPAPPSSPSPSPTATSASPTTTATPSPSTSPESAAPSPSTAPSTSPAPDPTSPAPAPAPAPAPVSTLGSVEGVVWFDRNQDGVRGTGEWPLPGVAVQLEPVSGDLRTASTNASPALTAVTGPQGDYRFDAVPVGRHRVTAAVSAPGFGYTSDTDGLGDWVVAVAVTGGQTSDADFAGLGKGSLGGPVFVDGTLTPVGDAPVTCTWAGFDDAFGTADDVQMDTVADTGGEFALQHVPYGEFSCRGSDPVTGALSATSRTGVWAPDLVQVALPIPSDAGPAPVVPGVPQPASPTTSALRARAVPALPRTGSSAEQLLVAAVVMLLAGASAQRTGRRRA